MQITIAQSVLQNKDAITKDGNVHRESLAKVEYFQCKHLSLTALHQKYLYIGLQTRQIIEYVQIIYWLIFIQFNSIQFNSILFAFISHIIQK